MLRTRNSCCRLRPWSTVVLLLACQGCIVKERTPISSQVVVPGGDTVERSERRDDLPNTPLITQTSMGSTFSIEPRGSIPYDGFTLPIACPTAGTRLLAVQSGRRPSWDVLLAQGTGRARAYGVSIYECAGAGKRPNLIVEHAKGIILGRAANHEGVLVERPNDNGSRWIGLAPWDGGPIQWLQNDDNVNAFGWIDDESTLVYAQRTLEEEHFELVVRLADGPTWRLEESLPYSWILPVLDPANGGLYALRLGDGYADLAWGRIDDMDTFRQTVVVHRVSDRVNQQRAWQILAATTGEAGFSTDQLAWFSFELGRLVLWNPKTGTVELLPPGTVAACASGGEREWLITTSQKLERLAVLKTTSATSTLFNNPWIARSIADGDVTIVLADEDSLEIAALNVSHVSATNEAAKRSELQGSSPSTSSDAPANASSTDR